MLCLKIYNPYKISFPPLIFNKNCGSREDAKKEAKEALANITSSESLFEFIRLVEKGKILICTSLYLI